MYCFLAARKHKTWYFRIFTVYEFSVIFIYLLCFLYRRMSRHVLLSRLAEQFQPSSPPPPAHRFPSPEGSISPGTPPSPHSPPRSPDSLSHHRLDLLQLGEIEIAGRALKQYARATGMCLRHTLYSYCSIAIQPS